MTYGVVFGAPMKQVDLTEILNLEARMRLGEKSPVADALLACANEIIALRDICSTKHVTVESNPAMQALCEELLTADNEIFTTNTDDLIETLGGIFKVTILAQGHKHG
jgi:hypothetical protein